MFIIYRTVHWSILLYFNVNQPNFENEERTRIQNLIFVCQSRTLLSQDKRHKMKYDYQRWARKCLLKVRNFLGSFRCRKSPKVCIFGPEDGSSLQITKKLWPQIKNSQSATFAEDLQNQQTISVCKFADILFAEFTCGPPTFDDYIHFPWYFLFLS